MLPGSVLLRPSDGRIDRNLCDVNALRHQLTRQALRQTSLRLACHRERTTVGISLHRCARIGKYDRAPVSVFVRLSRQHLFCRLLGHKEGAVGAIFDGLQHEVGIRLGYALAENFVNPPIYVVHDQLGCANSLSDGGKQSGDRRLVGRVIAVTANAMGSPEFLQHRFFDVSCRDRDLQPLTRKKPCTTCANTGAATNN